mmetsp:Transcript_15261/g.37675  ORF Transcript_15261/g.37675 Transcript_15261/m.37675 type:complete len:81 (-) Transcript_15261:170-412(-)
MYCDHQSRICRRYKKSSIETSNTSNIACRCLSKSSSPFCVCVCVYVCVCFRQLLLYHVGEKGKPPLQNLITVASNLSKSS